MKSKGKANWNEEITIVYTTVKGWHSYYVNNFKNLFNKNEHCTRKKYEN